MSRFPKPSIVLIILLGVLSASCGGSSPTSPSQPSAPYSQTDLVVGTGATVVAGQFVTFRYAGWLYDPALPDGKGRAFDSSAAMQFQIGVGRVIAGWDRGVPGMRVGGERRLVIPPELGYGSAGSGPIPGNATLVFDIAVLSIP